MRLCPHCGTQNPANETDCAQCGKSVVSLDRTMVGFAAPVPDRRLRGTMIGLAPPSAQDPQAPIPPAALAPPLGSEPRSDAPVPPTSLGLRQTMIGLAPSTSSPPVPAQVGSQYPTPPSPPTPPPANQRSPIPQPPIPPSAQAQLTPNRRTILGVAMPGIAPLNPGQAKPDMPDFASAPTFGAGTGVMPLSPPRLLLTPDPAASLASPTPKRGIPIVAAIAMTAAAGLFAAAAVVWLFYHGHGPIEAHATALANGSEKLELTCPACEDGSNARLDGATATFKATHATLPLSRPLKVGENPMTVTLVSPRGKQSVVDISVPLAFRVRGDTSGLDAPTPELRVLVSAVPGSIAVVDGKPVALSVAGEGRYSVDVSAFITGFEATVKPLERRLSYAITPPTGVTQNGTVNLQTGISPLVVDAPGPSVLLEGANFVLAGRTGKGGALSVGDRPITVDPTGRFAQMMNVSAPGETTIMLRATSKDNAPRLFPLRVRRVDSLAQEAERVRPKATNSYATIADGTETKRGWAVALDGAVVDARTENYRTVVVMDVEGGCVHAPCLARIIYGAPFSLARGDKLSAFGAVDGVVDGPLTGTHIPEVHADFLIKASK